MDMNHEFHGVIGLSVISLNFFGGGGKIVQNKSGYKIKKNDRNLVH